MRTVEYTHNDAEILKERFKILKPETIDRLCEYLKKNNKVVESSDCYDSRSGWSGTDFFIGMANLSCNGYCLRNDNVELFLNGGQDPMWYCFYNEEYDEAVKWQEENKPIALRVKRRRS